MKTIYQMTLTIDAKQIFIDSQRLLSVKTEKLFTFFSHLSIIICLLIKLFTYYFGEGDNFPVNAQKG